jgi:hypothetical protein
MPEIPPQARASGRASASARLPRALFELLAGVALAGSASGAEVVDLRVGTHAGYTRVVLQLDAPADHRIEWRRDAAGGPELEVLLSASATARRLDTDDGRVEFVALEPTGTGTSRASIRLRDAQLSYRETLLADPVRIVLDLQATSGSPEARAASAPRTAAPSPAQAPEAGEVRAGSAAAAPRVVDVRVGHHPGFTRVVFELDAPAGHRIGDPASEATGELVVVLEAEAVPSDLSVPRGPVRSLAIEPRPDGTSLARIALRDPGARVRESQLSDPPRILLDLSPRAIAAEMPPEIPPEPATPDPEPGPEVAMADPTAPVREPDAGGGRPRFRRPGGRLPPPQPAELPGERRRPLLTELDYQWVELPDRWRIVEALGVNERFFDPYHQSTLKADRPILGTQDWFLNLSLVSDTFVEPRRLPTPVGGQAERGGGALDVFGDGEQFAANQNLLVSTSLIRGDTVFRPPDYELRVTGVGNFNHFQAETLGVARIDPTRGTDRSDWHFGFQELFLDKHLWNKSDRYDFDSLRSGIQPITADFRGFLFLDVPLGARLFGTFENNRIQYNLAWFRRLEKDTNSGLNRVFDLRRDDVLLANVYYQDFPVLGFTLQGVVAYNRNREGGESVHRNENGFQERPAPFGAARPHDYDVVYLGLNGDGHIDRLNLTFSGYGALGHDDLNPIAARSQDIRAWFTAAEASLDFDWYRLKGFGLYASGDRDPLDGCACGFDAIFENPNFAGAETSFWVRQAIPLIGGGGALLSGRNAVLPSLRTSKEEGQSNFVNPGLGLVGVGADFDVLPELRLLANASWITFANTSSLRRLRVQGPISKQVGWDLSAGIVYRPLFIQNVVLRASGAVLIPGAGLEDLFALGPADSPLYSVLANVVLTY